MKTSSVILLLIIILLSGCLKEDVIVDPPPPVVNTGTADFSTFVVLGNSLTSGFQSNSLFQSAQEYSFGNLIAAQVKTKFEQPLISDPGTAGRIEIISTNPLKTIINLNSGNPLNIDYNSPYNNLGVPASYVYDILNATNKETSYLALGGGGGNQFINNILRGKGSQFSQAKSLNPTFMLLWIGNNDVLGYAISGGVFSSTPVSSFESSYRQLADSLRSLNTQLIIGNITDVNGLPYFTTVGIQYQLTGIDSIWGISSTGDTVYMSLKKNFITLRAAAEELYDFNGNSTGRGSTRNLPIRNQFILDEAEAETAADIVNKYNEIIGAVCREHNFTLVDFNYLFKTIKASEKLGGYVVDGKIFSTLYYYGNLFSLDGIHPSNQGYAIIANELIKIINQKYSAQIPIIKVSEIPNNFEPPAELKSPSVKIPQFSPQTFNYLPF